MIRQNPLAVKRASQIFISIILAIICMQLVAQLFTVNQLRRVSGVVADMGGSIAYSAGGKRRRGTPNYSMVLTLNDKHSYAVPYDGCVYNTDNIVQIGDTVVLYMPTFAYNLLSLDIIDFGTRTCQLEYHGQVLYSFAYHKSSEWGSIIYFALALLPFCYFLYSGYRMENLK